MEKILEINNLNKLEDKEELIFKAIEDIKKNRLRKEELSRLFDKIVIFDKNEIRLFTDKEEWYPIIKFAIKNHNKRETPQFI